MKQAVPTDAPGDAYLRLKWNTDDKFLIERTMVKSGGYRVVGGIRYGNGIVHHFKAAMSELMPWFEWHDWSNLLAEQFITANEIGIAGPASSGKTYTISACAYTYIQIYPIGTSIIMSTTTTQALQLRIWGALKEIHNRAKEIRDWLPGRVMESRCSLAFEKLESEGQDFRDGIIGVACRVGGTWIGISNYVGLKNDRIVLIADEAHLMERGFLNAAANLRKGSKQAPFKMVAMGNPKDTTDALGSVCEPCVEDGGWEGYDPAATTRTWKTRAVGGVAIQLCGYDTPNGKLQPGQEPYTGIITLKQIEDDAAYYGRESIEFTMMNLGIFPQNSIEKRVVTTTLCESHGAFDEVIWESKDGLRRAIGIDAAYSGVGGDRCVMTDLTWGMTSDGQQVMAYTCPPIIIPVNTKLKDQPEDQIADFIKEYCEREGIKAGEVGLDSTGRGTLVSSLGRRWSVDVVPIEFGGHPTDRVIQDKEQKTAYDAYGKFVTELWFASRAVIVGRQMRKLPRDVAREGSTRAWDFTKAMKQDVEPKHKTKERLGRSPDLWDSLVVAIEMARRNGFEIATLAPVGLKKRSSSPWIARALKAAKAARHELIHA